MVFLQVFFFFFDTIQINVPFAWENLKIYRLKDSKQKNLSKMASVAAEAKERSVWEMYD